MNTIIYNDFLTIDECNSLIHLAEETGYNQAKVNNPIQDDVDESYRKCFTSDINIEKVSWLKDAMFESLNYINSNDFKFSIKGITQLQVIKYTVGEFYKKHVDILIDELGYQRKLTFIIQLSNSNDYIGGDLNLYTEDSPHVMSRQQGSIIVFPSYTLHEVTPILSGTRYSLIGWCFGPEFK